MGLWPVTPFFNRIAFRYRLFTHKRRIDRPWALATLAKAAGKVSGYAVKLRVVCSVKVLTSAGSYFFVPMLRLIKFYARVAEMKKVKINFFTDIIAFVCFVFLLSTGVIMQYLLPPGSGRWVELWKMNRHEWGEIHFWLAIVFLAVVAFHLLMHWNWIVALVLGKTASGRLGEKNRQRICYGLVALLVLVLIAVAPIITFYV